MSAATNVVGRRRPETIVSADLSDSTEDLQPLADMFADASVIALGEATHGTREFFQVKHRLLQFLITELDIRVFAWEDSFATTRSLDDYVRRGEGDPTAILRSDDLYDTWRVESVLEMIEWLRSYNDGRASGEQVAFYGFDTQTVFQPARRLLQYFENAGPSLPEDREEELSGLTRVVAMPDESRLETADVVSDQLREQLADDRDDYVSTSSEGAWERTMRDLWSMDQALELWRADDGDLNTAESMEIREESMAENVSWLMEHEDVDQIAIWAHNEHVRRGPLRDSEYTTDDYSNGELR